ncbi:hypothetical protein BJ508DRAFT_85450 [Ascobolus immersus RN42]|uniref:C2H2-type domain-containing protein n=1 Tax=Ascobolus immersus RN42 TaxID=1160509 RepID=A0A3N4HF35_ASCIM|nr:hypothetical protein BJ508DRAFT_85450 [Ascobolus immersus RN42]
MAPIRISQLCYETDGLLDRIDDNLFLSPHHRRSLEDIRYRFMLWAQNVGCFASDKASIDYRLRDDRDTADVIQALVRTLNEHIASICMPPVVMEEEDQEDIDGLGQPTGREHNETDTGSADGSEDGSVDAASDTASSSVPSLNISERSGQDGPASTSPSLAPLDLDGRDTLIAGCNDFIDRLYSLLSVLRKPVSSSENTRVKAFILRKQQKQKYHSLLDGFDEYIAWYLSDWFHPLPDNVRDQLYNAALFRRMKLVYRRRHQKKLSEKLPKANDTADPDLQFTLGSNQLETITEDDGLPLTYGERLDATSPGQTQRQMLTAAQSVSAFGVSTVSSLPTVASSMNRNINDKVHKKPSGCASVITASRAARGKGLSVPPPPNAKGGDLSLCPYCWKFIDEEHTRDTQKWTKHILQDIEPYSCLFPDCRYADLLFRTPEEWLAHLQSEHASVWCCRAEGHESCIFNTQDELAEHIRTAHANSVTEAQIPSLLKKSPKPLSDIFNLPIGDWDHHEECTTCHRFSASFKCDQSLSGPDADSSLIYNRILAHLEGFALEVLYERGDEAATSHGSEGNRERSTLQGSWDAQDYNPPDGILGIETDHPYYEAVKVQLEAEWEEMDIQTQEIYEKVVQSIASRTGERDLEDDNDSILEALRERQTVVESLDPRLDVGDSDTGSLGSFPAPYRSDLDNRLRIKESIPQIDSNFAGAATPVEYSNGTVYLVSEERQTPEKLKRIRSLQSKGFALLLVISPIIPLLGKDLERYEPASFGNRASMTEKLKSAWDTLSRKHMPNNSRFYMDLKQNLIRLRLSFATLLSTVIDSEKMIENIFEGTIDLSWTDELQTKREFSAFLGGDEASLQTFFLEMKELLDLFSKMLSKEESSLASLDYLREGSEEVGRNSLFQFLASS